jgi:hypothetical protein
MIQLATGGFAVYSLYGVKETNTSEIDGQSEARMQSNMQRRVGEMQYESLVADLQGRADIIYLKTEDEQTQ